MRKQAIGLRELLEQVLPLDQLRPREHSRVQSALRTGVGRELEAAARMALERLGEARPAARSPKRRIESPGIAPSAPAVTIERREPVERDGVHLYPRETLPARAGADLTQVRRLLHVEAMSLLSDPRSSEARATLHRHLGEAGQELVGTDDLYLFPLPDPTVEAAEKPLDSDLAAEALARPDRLFYCPDFLRSRRLGPLSVGGLRGVAWVAVVSSEHEPLGLLEVRSRQPSPFQPEDLARVALIADFCGTVLERAARIEKLVFVDSTTGVYNRSYFELQARNEIARALRDQASVALCIADIDDFKAVNTAYGYEAGNAVLTQVAQTLKRGVRPFDTVARWGGEEFAVLLTPPVESEDVAAVCERLRVAVDRLLFQVEGLDRRVHPIRVSVSMGVALFPEHATDAQDLWRAANQALLIAKQPPKNRVVFHRRG